MKSVIHMIATLSIIGIIAGGLLAGVSEWATPFIEANKKAETERAIYVVQPMGKTYEKLSTNFEVYKVFNEEKNVEGYSLVYEGNGFQGKIRLMVGLTNDLSKITSMEVLEQSETPGLGTKVTEEPYKGQFQNLITSPKIEWVKGTPATKPNEIEAITGATISSTAVVAIVNAGISRMRELQERGEL